LFDKSYFVTDLTEDCLCAISTKTEDFWQRYDETASSSSLDTLHKTCHSVLLIIHSSKYKQTKKQKKTFCFLNEHKHKRSLIELSLTYI